MANYIKLADGTIVEVGTAKEFTPEEWVAYKNDLQQQINTLSEEVGDMEADFPTEEEEATLLQAYEEYNALLYLKSRHDTLVAKVEELQKKFSEAMTVG